MKNLDNVVGFNSGVETRGSVNRLNHLRLTEARLAKRITQTELSKRVGVTRQSISYYEMGQKSPEPLVMSRIAAELEQPLYYFTKQAEESFGVHGANFFRKVGADTKRRNMASAVYAKWLSCAAYQFNSVANFPKLAIPEYEPNGDGCDSYTDEEIEDIAEEVRSHFGLGLGPISNMVRLLESKGVIIARVQMTGEKVEAFSYWSGEQPFIILSSDKKSAARSRFDAAHELGHLCLHKWVGEEQLQDKDRLKQIESEADRFAGAFLLPKKSFPNEVFSSKAEGFIPLKSRWKVSIQAMIYRCKNLGLFDDHQVTNLYKQISYKKWRTIEPLDRGNNALVIEEPLLLKKIAELVFDSGALTVGEYKRKVGYSDNDLSQLIGIPVATSESTAIETFKPTLK